MVPLWGGVALPERPGRAVVVGGCSLGAGLLTSLRVQRLFRTGHERASVHASCAGQQTLLSRIAQRALSRASLIGRRDSGGEADGVALLSRKLAHPRGGRTIPLTLTTRCVCGDDAAQ
jgi:hypothetical protein